MKTQIVEMLCKETTPQFHKNVKTSVTKSHVICNTIECVWL